MLGAGALVAIVIGVLVAVVAGGDSTDDGDERFCEALGEPVWGRTDDGGAVEVIVFLDPDSGEVGARLERELTDDADVASFTFVDQDEAHEEFERLFADVPEMLSAVSPGVLPPSARVALAPGSGIAPDTWARRWEGEPGVFRVVTADDTLGGLSTVGGALLGPLDASRPGDVVPITAPSDAVDTLTEAAPPEVSAALAEIEEVVGTRSHGGLRSVEVTAELTDAARTVVDHADAACGEGWRGG